MLPQFLKIEFENIIDKLQQPPSEDEVTAGWHLALKAQWANWFVELRDNLEAGKELRQDGNFARNGFRWRFRYRSG